MGGVQLPRDLRHVKDKQKNNEQFEIQTLTKSKMSQIKFYKQEEQVPLEMHKVRIVQKLYLPTVEEQDKLAAKFREDFGDSL